MSRISQLYGGPSVIGFSVDILIGGDDTLPILTQLMPTPTVGAIFEKASFAMWLLVAGGSTPMFVKQGGAGVVASSSGDSFALMGSLAPRKPWRLDVIDMSSNFVSIFWPGGAQSKIRFARIDAVSNTVTAPEPPIIIV